MITLNKAKGLALESLTRLTGRPPGELLFIDELTQCRSTGWLFFYESRVHLENGTIAIGGTGSVVVTHSGEVQHVAPVRPVEEVLHDCERPIGGG